MIQATYELLRGLVFLIVGDLFLLTHVVVVRTLCLNTYSNDGFSFISISCRYKTSYEYSVPPIYLKVLTQDHRRMRVSLSQFKADFDRFRAHLFIIITIKPDPHTLLFCFF